MDLLIVQMALKVLLPSNHAWIVLRCGNTSKTPYSLAYTPLRVYLQQGRKTLGFDGQRSQDHCRKKV